VRQGNPCTRGAIDSKGRVNRYVRKVGWTRERPFAPEQEHQLPATLNPDLTGQWQNQPLKLPSGHRSRLTRGKSHDIEAGVFPTRLPRPDGHIETCPTRRTRLTMPLTHDAPPYTSCLLYTSPSPRDRQKS